MVSSVLLLTLACGPGQLVSDDGTEPLRTALFRDEGDRVVVLLSNSTFPCELPAEEDPQDQSLRILELATAACREGARHVLLDLYRSPDLDWSGDYVIHPDASTASAAADQTREARVRHVAVEEAVLVLQDGLERQYQAVEQLTLDADAGDLSVDRREDRLQGQLEVPRAPLSVDFTARTCPETGGIFDLLRASPVSACP